MKFFSNATVARRLTLGFGLMLVILAAVAVLAMFKVQTIDAALRANSEQNALIQRYAINFRGSAHDRAIAIRDVVLAATPADGERERATIQELAAFYANSAGPLEKLVSAPGAEPELARLYAGIQAIEARAVATT
jgi:methyl-accepting chemotaxis protein